MDRRGGGGEGLVTITVITKYKQSKQYWRDQEVKLFQSIFFIKSNSMTGSQSNPFSKYRFFFKINSIDRIPK